MFLLQSHKSAALWCCVGSTEHVWSPSCYCDEYLSTCSQLLQFTSLELCGLYSVSQPTRSDVLQGEETRKRMTNLIFSSRIAPCFLPFTSSLPFIPFCISLVFLHSSHSLNNPFMLLIFISKRPLLSVSYSITEWESFTLTLFNIFLSKVKVQDC